MESPTRDDLMGNPRQIYSRQMGNSKMFERSTKRAMSLRHREQEIIIGHT